MNTCYMCDKPATSKEHVPPKCLFTRKRSSTWTRLSKESNKRSICDEHNSLKSKDDEYLMLVIGMHCENNLDAQRHFGNSVKRALRRNQNLFRVYKNLRPVSSSGNIGAIFEVDKPRLERVLTNMIRGLYFHIHKEKWLKDVQLISNGLKMINYEHFLDSAKYNAFLAYEFEGLRKLMVGHEKIGNNPSVFYYQQETTDSAEVLRLVFYDGFEVVALLEEVRWIVNRITLKK